MVKLFSNKEKNNRFNKAIFLLIILVHIPPCTTSSHIINNEIIISPDTDTGYKLQLEMNKRIIDSFTCQSNEIIESDWIFIPARIGNFDSTQFVFSEYYSEEDNFSKVRSKVRGKVNVSEDSVEIFLEYPINDSDNNPEYFEYDKNGKYKLVYKGNSSQSKKIE